MQTMNSPRLYGEPEAISSRDSKVRNQALNRIYDVSRFRFGETPRVAKHKQLSYVAER
jgi:hypothetical protein